MSRPIYPVDDLKNYIKYGFETQGFTAGSVPGSLKAPVLEGALKIRGKDNGSAIMIHGIMPRSGTVYAGELLRLHPTLYAYPDQLWEFPALPLTAHIHKVQKRFMLNYKPSADKLADVDFLPLFGSALIAYLYSQSPEGKRVLVKTPSAQYLPYFFNMFPYENLLILLRDGRDVVHSTLRTWPHLNFVQVCLRWHRSAQAILRACEHFVEQGYTGYRVARFEDALQDPANFVREMCEQFDLDEACYPYEKVESIRVIGSSKLAKNKKVTWRHHKRPNDFRPQAYWKTWSSLKKALFKLIAGSSLRDLDYAQNMKW